MTDTRLSARLPLSMILVAVLSLLAFLPLALPTHSKPARPVHEYTTSGNHNSTAPHQAIQSVP